MPAVPAADLHPGWKLEDGHTIEAGTTYPDHVCIKFSNGDRAQFDASSPVRTHESIARDAVYDREFDGLPRPWVPDPSDVRANAVSDEEGA